MNDLRIASAVMAAAICLGYGATAQAGCAVDDADFNTQDGGCKDLTSGLVWGSDAGHSHSAGNGHEHCDFFDTEGFTDWRLPTTGEVEEAVANGLNLHLDFYQAAENQPVDDLYRQTNCRDHKGRAKEPYVIRFDTLDVIETGDGGNVICVRGLPELADSCPAKNKGGGPKGPKKTAMSASMFQGLLGVILLLPVALVFGTGRREEQS